MNGEEEKQARGRNGEDLGFAANVRAVEEGGQWVGQFKLIAGAGDIE